MLDRLTGFVGAVAVVGTGAFSAISLAALLGVASTPGPDRIAVVVLAVLAALAMPPPQSDRWRSGAWVGVAVAVLGIVALEFLFGERGVGAGQIGAVGGALVTFPVLARAWSLQPIPWLAWVGLALVFVLAAVALVRTIIEGGGLGHDESAYALKARTWLAGTPDTGWQLHRAPLNTLLGLPIIAITDSEVALRAMSAALALGALAGVGLVAGRIKGRWAAVVAVATVAVSHPFLRRGAEYLTDVPSAGLLLVIVWLVLKTLDDPDRHHGLVIWLGPLIAAAFYMRYQSSLAIVGIALATMVVWPRVVARLKKELLVAGGVVLVLRAPHLVWATLSTGRPWGVVLFTGGAAGRQFLGEGLVDYVRLFPLELAGPAGAGMAAIGIAVVIWSTLSYVRGRRDRWHSIGLFVSIVVIVAVVPLGLVAHGEPRFVFFPMWLLIAVGAAFVVGLAERLSPPYRAMAVALAVLVWIPLFTETVRRVDRNAEARGDTFAVVVDASDLIEDDGDGNCAVLTTYQPQVTWYSTCVTELLRLRDDTLGEDRLSAERNYVLLFENGKRQPEPAVVEEHIDLTGAITVPARDDRIGDATIVELNPG